MTYEPSAKRRKTQSFMEKKLAKIWHPTAKWCCYVAFVLKEKLPREHGVVPSLLRMIREMLPSSYMEYLQLDYNQITDAGAIKLAEMLPSSKLTCLGLGGNQITDAGTIKLAEMLPSSKLTKLVLYNNKITDAGAIKLAEALPHSKLSWLHLNGNQITDAKKTALNNIKNSDGEGIYISI